MKMVRFAGIILVVMLFSGCGETTAEHTKNTSGKVDKPITQPDAVNYDDWGSVDYYSDISYQAIQDYLQKLQKDGWKPIDKNAEFPELSGRTAELTLTDKKRILQLIITIENKQNSYSNSIIARLDEEPAELLKDRAGALTKAEAQRQIQAFINSQKDNSIPVKKQIITSLVEIFPKDAYEKMKLQAYAAISEGGLTGHFLVCNQSVVQVMGSLENTVVVDLDGNGKYELLDLFGFGSGILRYVLAAYEYSNPVYFNSLTEVLYMKYYNCFVQAKGFDDLRLKKLGENQVMLIGAHTEYGELIIQEPYLTLNNLDDFPFEEKHDIFEKQPEEENSERIPEVPPAITISIDGRGLDYITQATVWGDKREDLMDPGKVFAGIMKKGWFIPTYQMMNPFEDNKEDSKETCRQVVLDFGKNMPDKVIVDDMMLEDWGAIRYGSKLITEREVEVIDDSRICFELTQHIAYALSSNSKDYYKDWYRLFRIHCTWGENECIYMVLINTGGEDAITEIDKKDFLRSKGSYSKLSSDWGIGLSIEDTSDVLPDRYYIEWQVDGGEIRKWKKEELRPEEITELHNGYPVTFSGDENNGEVIWSPLAYNTGEKTKIKVYIYRTLKDRSPIACSEITLKCINGIWKEL